MLTIDILLEKKDYAFFSYYTEFGLPEDRKKSKSFFIKILLYISISILLLWINRDNKIISIFCCVIIAANLVMILGKIAPRMAIKRRINSIYKKPENKYIFEKKEYIFNEFGITITGKSFSTKASWDFIIKKSETVDYLLLYVSDLQACIIPKKCLNDWQTEALDKLLTQHLNFRTHVGNAVAE